MSVKIRYSSNTKLYEIDLEWGGVYVDSVLLTDADMKDLANALREEGF